MVHSDDPGVIYNLVARIDSMPEIIITSFSFEVVKYMFTGNKGVTGTLRVQHIDGGIEPATLVGMQSRLVIKWNNATDCFQDYNIILSEDIEIFNYEISANVTDRSLFGEYKFRSIHLKEN